MITGKKALQSVNDPYYEPREDPRPPLIINDTVDSRFISQTIHFLDNLNGVLISRGLNSDRSIYIWAARIHVTHFVKVIAELDAGLVINRR